MSYFTLKDTNKNGKPYLYIVEYDAAKTKLILDYVRDNYSGEERKMLIQNSRRGTTEKCLGRFDGTLPTIIKSFEERQNEELELELGRPLTEEEKFSLKLTEKEIEFETKALNKMLEELQLDAKVREWRIDYLLKEYGVTEESFRNKEEFIDVPKKQVSAAWKKYRNNLFQEFRNYCIDKYKAKGLRHTEAQIQFNEQEKLAYEKAMGISN